MSPSPVWCNFRKLVLHRWHSVLCAISFQLVFSEKETMGPSVMVHFQDCKMPIALPVEKSIEVALNLLKSSSTESYYRRQAWEVIKCFLVSTMNLDDDKASLSNLFTHSRYGRKHGDCFGRVPIRISSVLLLLFLFP